MTALSVDALIAELTRWAENDDRVVAAGLCGSYARGEAGPESDVDLCIISLDPESLLSDRSWIGTLGPDARTGPEPEDYGLVQSLRVFYGSLEVEFGVTARAWIDLPLEPGTARVMADGLRILYDPEGHLQKALACARSSIK